MSKENAANHEVKIRKDGKDVIVLDKGKEVYRSERTRQTNAIALDVYFYHKYNNRENKS